MQKNIKKVKAETKTLVCTCKSIKGMSIILPCNESHECHLSGICWLL